MKAAMAVLVIGVALLAAGGWLLYRRTVCPPVPKSPCVELEIFSGRQGVGWLWDWSWRVEEIALGDEGLRAKVLPTGGIALRQDGPHRATTRIGSDDHRYLLVEYEAANGAAAGIAVSLESADGNEFPKGGIRVAGKGVTAVAARRVKWVIPVAEFGCRKRLMRVNVMNKAPAPVDLILYRVAILSPASVVDTVLAGRAKE